MQLLRQYWQPDSPLCSTSRSYSSHVAQKVQGALHSVRGSCRGTPGRNLSCKAVQKVTQQRRRPPESWVSAAELQQPFVQPPDTKRVRFASRTGRGLLPQRAHTAQFLVLARLVLADVKNCQCRHSRSGELQTANKRRAHRGPTCEREHRVAADNHVPNGRVNRRVGRYTLNGNELECICGKVT